jgi:hypothetical protein
MNCCGIAFANCAKPTSTGPPFRETAKPVFLPFRERLEADFPKESTSIEDGKLWFGKALKDDKNR